MTGSRVRKNRVAFPAELTRVIGYGGDDYSDSDDDSTNDVQIVEADRPESDSRNEEEEVDVPQNEDDRALTNLTRVNTNFNMVTANLTAAPSETKPKTLGLMLGRMQKDADGNKTTLLISVTPFGDDVSVPTARRPIERKRNDERPVGLEKIVDMPLIASSNLMAIKKTEAPSSPARVPDLEIAEAKQPIKAELPVDGRRECATETMVGISEDKPRLEDGKEGLDAREEDLLNPDPNCRDLGERIEGEEPIEAPCSLDDKSREDTGLPDGEADVTSLECPSISTAPRQSFLHSEPPSMKKPTVHPKTISVEAKEINATKTDDAMAKAIKPTHGNAENTERLAEGSKDEEGSENLSSGNGKRRMAPKPPEVSEDTSGPLFARKPNFKVNPKADCPVVREMEKRERATTSSSPKLKKSLGPTVEPLVDSIQSENSPEPRRSISLSHQDITSCTLSTDKLDEKKKSKSRFSLKKLLRMGGSRKDMNLMSTMASSATKADELPGTSQPKPRLEIIHPLELDGAAVEVLRHDKLTNSQEDAVNDSRQESVTVTG